MTRPRPRIGSELLPVGLILASLAGTFSLVVAMHRRGPAASPTSAPAPVAVASTLEPEPAEPPPPPPPARPKKPRPAAPTPEDPTKSALERLARARAEQVEEARGADRRAEALEVARRAALADSGRWKRREMLVKTQLDALSERAERLESDADAMALERDVLARERDEAKAALAKARTRTSYAVLPHRGPNGTWRRPIIVECRNGTATLQPHGPTYSLMDMAGSFGLRSSLIVAAVSREVVKAQMATTPDGAPAVPYIFFLIRPDGVRPYYLARKALEPLGIAFGYELVEQDWEIDFPDLDNPADWDGASPRPAGPSPEVASGPTRPLARPRRDDAPPDSFVWPSQPRGAAVANAGLDGPLGPGSGSGRGPGPGGDADKPGSRGGGASFGPDGSGAGVRNGLGAGGSGGDPTFEPFPVAGPGGGVGFPGGPGHGADGGKGLGSGGSGGDPSLEPFPVAGGGGGGGFSGGPAGPDNGADVGKGPGAGGSGGDPSLEPFPVAGTGGAIPKSFTVPPPPHPGPPPQGGREQDIKPSPLAGEGLGGGSQGTRARQLKGPAGPNGTPGLPDGPGATGRNGLASNAPNGLMPVSPGGLPGLDDPSPSGSSGGGVTPSRLAVARTAAGGSGASPGAGDFQWPSRNNGPSSDDPGSNAPGAGGSSGASGGSTNSASGSTGSGNPSGRAGSTASGGGGSTSAGGSPSSALASGAAGGGGPPMNTSAAGGVPIPLPLPSGGGSGDATDLDELLGRNGAGRAEKKPRKIEVPFEMVVACGPEGVVIHPGGYRLSPKALKGPGDLLAKELRSVLHTRQMVDPMIRPRPSLRFLVEPGGDATYREARRQTVLSHPDWPVTFQVGDTTIPGPLARGSF